MCVRIKFDQRNIANVKRRIKIISITHEVVKRNGKQSMAGQNVGQIFSKWNLADGQVMRSADGKLYHNNFA